MATKSKTQQVRTITVEQAARYLAVTVTNMAIEHLLANARRVSGKFNITSKNGWAPKDGKEIDDGYSILRYAAEDSVYAGLESERKFFVKELKKDKRAYDKTALTRLNLTVE